MPPRFFLQTIGGLTLTALASGEPVLVNQRKRLAFMAALAADVNGGTARERLFALFWPESDSERARNALNQLVYGIRQHLGDDSILTETVLIRLNSAVVDSDLRRFRNAFTQARFADAIDTYRGPFLDGVFLRETPSFERWANDLRESLAVDYVRALEREVDAALNATPTRSADAVRYARLLAAHEPLSTHGALRLMRAFERSGDKASALRHAGSHAAHVRAELDSEPGPELEREVARIRVSGAVVGDAELAPATIASVSTEQAISPGLNIAPRLSDPRRPSRWRGPRMVAVVGVAFIAFLAVASWRRRNVSSVDADDGDNARVLVTAFTNRTGDSTLDYIGYIASDWITQGLSQSEIVKVVYGPTAYELSRSTPNSGSSDADRVRQLSARSRAGTVIGGSYYLVHDSIVISAQVTEGRTGRVLRAVPPIAAPKSDPMHAVQPLRERSVGALATVADSRIASISGLSSSPPLMEAYRDYLGGLELFRQGRIPKVSLERFLVAARRDSTFLLPALWAVWMAGYAGQNHLRDSLLQVLERHRNQLALIDRYALDFEKIARDQNVSGQQRLAAVHRVVELAPASNWSWIEAGCLFSAGSANAALTDLEHIDPEHGWAGAWNPYWVLLSNVQHSLGKYAAQLQSAERSRKLRADRGFWPATQALIGLGRIDSVMVLLRTVPAEWGEEERISVLAAAAAELLAHGYRPAGDSLSHLALDWYRAHTNRPDNGLTDWVFRIDYVGLTLQAGTHQDIKAAADAMLSDHRAIQENGEEFALWAHGALGVAAATRGDRDNALAEIRRMPDMTRLPRQMRWRSSELKALVAGALHDRQLALRYLVEMESQGAQGLQDAATVADHSPQLKWLANDPRIRLPYLGTPPAQ